MLFRRGGFLAAVIFGAFTRVAWCASGTEGASFLDIPVGGAPAAVGSAYTSQANDAYAPVWNPAGLGFLHATEFSGMHLNYIRPVNYESVSLVVPIGLEDDNASAPAGFGGSIQYLGTGDLDSRDESGNPLGTFSATFAAYTLAYGRKISETVSLGAAGKLITEKIADASAKAYATDLGLFFKPSSTLNVGAVIANLGSKIKLVNESDPLPLAGRFGGTYRLSPQWDLSAETVYRKTGLLSGSLGTEWRYGQAFSFRGGYNTSHTKELGAASGFTGGLGLFFWGQEFAYAWVPVGDLGHTHYFSLVFRTSTQARPERPRLQASGSKDFEDEPVEDPAKYHDIFDILKTDERKSVF